MTPEEEKTLNLLLKALGDEIHANKVARGWKVTTAESWKDPHEVPAGLMLITTEVAEAMEAFRHNDLNNFTEELADILIRVIGLSYGMNLDLVTAMSVKMSKNQTREHKHGGKRL